MKLQKTMQMVCMLALIGGFSIAASNEAYAQRGWLYLGQSRVDGRVDRDRIAVRARGRFRAIQLGIRGGTIEFQRVVVHFANGADHEVEVRDRIRSGGKTRLIDLPGDRRDITSVEFWYSKPNWRSARPYVNLWGRR